ASRVDRASTAARLHLDCLSTPGSDPPSHSDRGGKEQQVKGRTTCLGCLIVAAAVALLAPFPVQAGAANPHRLARVTPAGENRSATGRQDPGQNAAPPTDAGHSYFWADAGIAAAVLAGLLVLGLWGDRAVGGVIFGIERLRVGAARTTSKVR